MSDTLGKLLPAPIYARINSQLGHYLGVFVVSVVLVIAWITGRIAATLESRINLAAEIATRVAEGDLSVEVPVTGDGDESGRLLKAIHGMTASLNSLVTRVQQASIELLSHRLSVVHTGRPCVMAQ